MLSKAQWALTNVGKQIVTGRLLGGIGAGVAGAALPNYIAWGTAAGTAAIADTALFTEAAEARVAGTASRVTTTTTNDTFQVVGTMTSSSTQSITNAGLFDAATAGNLFVKGDFTGVALANGDSIAFTFKWQLQ